jgi:hypothetical protein
VLPGSLIGRTPGITCDLILDVLRRSTDSCGIGRTLHLPFRQIPMAGLDSKAHESEQEWDRYRTYDGDSTSPA